MSLLVPPRRPAREHLDDPDLAPDEMRRSLEDLRLVNRRWGASRALERHIVERARALGRNRVSILDVGAGSGEAASRLRGALGRAGLSADVLALDIQWRHLAVGRLMGASGGPPAVTADAFRMPFRDGAFDFSVSTLFFHHFSPAENRRLLAELGRVARHGFAMLDLRRHRVPELFVALAGRAIFRARISVEDGVASVRQAYTPSEALAVARAVDPRSTARRVFPFRILVAGGP
ncbi:MAG: methyltransferase domain-containing protein [Thermoanaerobaculia bacterium]